MNPSERGVTQPEERLTRRDVLKGLASLAAAALIAGGCNKIDISQTTGLEGNGRPQVSEPQIDITETVYDVLALYVAGVILLGAVSLFPPKER